METQIEKILSANDTGETGGHQAGLLIPRNPRILAFFPLLAVTTKNPRCVIDMVDGAGEEWTFSYIYYNNRKFGGTRNEYRLTGMTEFIRRHALKTGDVVTFVWTGKHIMRITHRRKNEPVVDASSGRKILKLSGSWTVVDSDRFA